MRECLPLLNLARHSRVVRRSACPPPPPSPLPQRTRCAQRCGPFQRPLCPHSLSRPLVLALRLRPSAKRFRPRTLALHSPVPHALGHDGPTTGSFFILHGVFARWPQPPPRQELLRGATRIERAPLVSVSARSVLVDAILCCAQAQRYFVDLPAFRMAKKAASGRLNTDALKFIAREQRVSCGPEGRGCFQ